MNRFPGMLTTVALILALAPAGACAADQTAPAVLALGAEAPMDGVKMKGVDAKQRSIGEVRGDKGTLVVFTCNTCPWAKAWEERIVVLGNTYTKRGIGVIAINSNDPGQSAEDGFEVMQQRAKRRGMRFPYVVDASSGVARAFGATRTPEVFLFDAGGKLVYHGTVDDNGRDPGKVTKSYLRDALQSVAEGKPVAVAETKALGCSIKFRKT